MRRVLVATFVILTAVLVAPRADAQTVLPADDRFVLGLRTGFQHFSYTEKIGAIESSYDSVGPALGLSAHFRILDRLRLNLDLLGTFIQENTETWKNLGTVAGLPISQQNEMDVNFAVFDIDASYSFLKTSRFDWALALGWHYYQENFTRSNFRFLVATIVIPVNILPVSEDVTGQGIKFGTTLRFMATDKLSLQGGFAYYSLYDVQADNSRLGKVGSDGDAFRWRVALDYFVARNFTLETGYEGHFINVSQGRSARAILPRNETRAHTFLVGLGIRF